MARAKYSCCKDLCKVPPVLHSNYAVASCSLMISLLSVLAANSEQFLKILFVFFQHMINVRASFLKSKMHLSLKTRAGSTVILIISEIVL